MHSPMVAPIRNIGARVPPEVLDASATNQEPSFATHSSAAAPSRNRPLTASVMAQ